MLSLHLCLRLEVFFVPSLVQFPSYNRIIFRGLFSLLCRFSFSLFLFFYYLRGTTVIRTCNLLENLYILRFSETIFGPDYYVPR